MSSFNRLFYAFRARERCLPRAFLLAPTGLVSSKGDVMANHFTPEELAKELGMETAGLIEFCRREGIPIYKGKIDRSLLAVVMKAKGFSLPEPKAVTV